MGERNPSYVKLTKELDAVEITPGELNQPVNVPQLNVRRCPECGQPLPDGFETPSDEAWTSGICGCAQDPESCKYQLYSTRNWTHHVLISVIACLAVVLAGMTGLFCPCVLFGRNINRLKEEVPWTNPCICHGICVEGGIAIAALVAFFNGYMDPNTIRLFGEGLLFAWWICGIYNGLFREELQRKYHLENSPCDPCLVHCCMHCCALCQEHREMKGRLSENPTTPTTVLNPPPPQEMVSDSRLSSSSSSSERDGHHKRTGLEIQPV